MTYWSAFEIALETVDQLPPVDREKFIDWLFSHMPHPFGGYFKVAPGSYQYYGLKNGKKKNGVSKYIQHKRDLVKELEARKRKYAKTHQDHEYWDWLIYRAKIAPYARKEAHMSAYRRSQNIIVPRYARYRKKRRYFRKGYDRGPVGRYLPEVKFADTEHANATVVAAGAVLQNNLLGLTQGTGDGERVGNIIHLKSIQFNFQMTLPPTTIEVEGGDAIRIVVYMDTQCNGAAVTLADVYDAPTVAINSFRNLSETRRIKILMDKRISMNATAVDAGSATTFQMTKVSKFFKKFNDLRVDYGATTSAITSVRDVNIGVIAFTAGGDVELTFLCRIRYVDA